MSKMQNAFWTENAQLDYWTLSTSTSMTKVPSNVELVTDKRSVHERSARARRGIRLVDVAMRGDKAVIQNRTIPFWKMIAMRSRAPRARPSGGSQTDFVTA